MERKPRQSKLAAYQAIFKTSKKAIAKKPKTKKPTATIRPTSCEQYTQIDHFDHWKSVKNGDRWILTQKNLPTAPISLIPPCVQYTPIQQECLDHWKSVYDTLNPYKAGVDAILSAPTDQLPDVAHILRWLKHVIEQDKPNTSAKMWIGHEDVGQVTLQMLRPVIHPEPVNPEIIAQPENMADLLNTRQPDLLRCHHI